MILTGMGATAFMSFSFWITLGLLSLSLIYTFFKLRVKNTINKNRTRLLQSLGFSSQDDPVFLGFFHPYW
jgi:hypothetical protein